ncbi:UvrD-helicase domain-containing protein [Williamsia sterculiae]|uniref:RecBCD enzyme subunit RecB n=1 Tax=Williamsia sterculiae TaxID=1344003 RepID=A0A1N7H2D5_9NOCA|nr:UvrD-helicase domain-containing protein [Williamsia sterculiae]SIS18999.1 exodeoxyribonuclease V beta subunit [Williamsia sterculiae]
MTAQPRLTPAAFEVTGAPPTGTTVLEASAGTGKTFAIVGLAARLIAEGLDISELLLVTFSRLASAELRERTRDRLARLEVALRDPVAAAEDPDELTAFLARGAIDEVALRHRRVADALSNFDAATIATTHTFCSRMLDWLGIAGEAESDVTLVEEVDELTAEVAGDVFLNRFARNGPAFAYKHAGEIAKQSVRQRYADLRPDGAADGEVVDDPEVAARLEFATVVRREVDRRKRLHRIRDYDDLQLTLRDVLRDPDHGAAAAARIRERFSVVLVDEFQDTDPVQWEIFRRCFHGHRTLVIVGDPKQAIYSFRGAEVLSYLDAVAHADHHQVLPVNHRTDAPLLAALDHLYGGAALGNDQIVVHTVGSSHAEPRVHGGEPLRLRQVIRAGHPLKKTGFPTVGLMRDAVVDDVAADIADLLAGGRAIDAADGTRPLAAGDVVVLVRRRDVIPTLQEKLADHGVVSVVGAGRSVFSTDSARHWLWLLQAVEQPGRTSRARLAALTPLIGRRLAELDDGGEQVVAELSRLLRDLSRLFATTGFAALFEHLSGATDLEARVLGTESGERILTDLRHVASLCNTVVVNEGMGLAALIRWLADRIDDPALGNQADQSRRLDKDAHAVQIMTVHASKGLQFPVVYVPFGWDAAKSFDNQTLSLHDAAGRRLLDVRGPDARGYRVQQDIADDEESGDDLRLFYVAVTRAQSQVVVHWAPSYNTKDSALQRMLFGRDPGSASPGGVPARSVSVPDDNTVFTRLQEWAGPRADLIGIERAVAQTPVVVAPTDDTVTPELTVSRFTRTVDTTWRRTSYSAIVAAADHSLPVVTDEPEESLTDDEPDDADDLLVVPSGTPGGAPSLMNAMPYGAAFGTLVHEILEEIDTGADDLTAEVTARCAAAVGRRLVDVDTELLATALMGVLRTPLGFGDLAAITPSDRLSELDFELPLAGGDIARPGAATVAGIADAMAEHLPSGDPLVGYPARLREVSDLPLRGFLVGSIDAVLRVDGPRFVVVDYKTNRLGTGDLTVGHYTRSAMAEEMMRAHYPLQALLYSVALHRYLRWRLRGYDPRRHLAPVQYHFVRGMAGPDTPADHGVFEWAIPADLVSAVSELLAGGS